MSVRFHFDVYQFVSNKWTWLFVGIILLIISATIRVNPADSSIMNDALKTINSITFGLGFLFLAIWIIWWIYENYAAIMVFFDS